MWHDSPVERGQIMNRNYVLGKNTRKHISTTTNNMQLLVKTAMEECNSRMLDCPDWGVSEGLRTAKQQWQRYLKGRDAYGRLIYPDQMITECDGTIKMSDHQSGNAIDFYAIGADGKADYSDGAMSLVFSCFATAAMKLGFILEWGGSYNTFKDTGHVAIKRVL